MSDSDSEPKDEDTQPWVTIQKDTFTNWVNDKLKAEDVTIKDIRLDFRDGVNLCKLMRALVGGPIGKIIQKDRALNKYEARGNLALALQTMEKDKVHLVNIGAEDVSSGNQKLILGIVWCLIRRYQIGSKGRLPTKKIMLAWINAVLHPHLEVTNFTSDWNDGAALHGLVNYCSPGTFPDWSSMPRHDRFSNCEKAMNMAQQLFGIPLVVSPENMSAGDLDELSTMTYLSYFMTRDAPGYNATLSWVRKQTDPTPVNNFTSDWHSGYVISHLVHSLGGNVPDWPDLDTSNGQSLCTRAIEISKKDLGVPAFITAKDMTQKDGDHIAVMAYAEWHRALTGGLPAQPTATPIPTPVTYTAPDPEPEPVISEPDVPLEPEPEPEPEPEREEIDQINNSNADSLTESEGASSADEGTEPQSEVPREVTQQNEVPYEELPDEEPPNRTEDSSSRGVLPFAAPAGYGKVMHRENQVQMSKCTNQEKQETKEIQNGGDDSFDPYEELPDEPASVYNGAIPPPGALMENGVIENHAPPSDEVYTEVTPIRPAPAVMPHEYGEGKNAGLGHKSKGSVIDVTSGSSDEEEAPPLPPHPNSNDDITLLMKDEWKIDMPVTFHIKVIEESARGFKVKVKSPQGNEQLLPVVRSDDLMYDVTFTPDERGVWIINVTENDVHVTGSPHQLLVYDVSKAEIVRHYKGSVPCGEPTSFQVQTDGAFNDDVSVHVIHDNMSLPVSLASPEHHMHRVTFTPQTDGIYSISVYLGGAEISDSPFTIEAEMQGEVFVRGQGLRAGVQGQKSKFQLDTRQLREKPLAILITGPNGITIDPEIEKVDDLIKVSYIPTAVGTYRIEVVYNNVPVNGSPFRPEVEAGKQIYVIGMPTETEKNQTYSFIVDAREMPKGTLEIDSDLPVLNYEKEGEKQYKVTFIPRKSGKHDIVIRYNEQVMADSPYVIMVR